MNLIQMIFFINHLYLKTYYCFFVSMILVVFKMCCNRSVKSYEQLDVIHENLV